MKCDVGGAVGCRAVAAGSDRVTDAGWAALFAGVRSNPKLALEELCGVRLTKYDDTLPDNVVRRNSGWNRAVLSYLVRITRRLAAVAVLRTAWRRSHGQPVHGSAVLDTPAAKLAHMLQLRRLCRVRDGRNEVVEPFGRAVVAYL